MRIVIVDYGVGNLGSIQNMFKKIGARAELSGDPSVVAAADKLVLPGVGAFDACVNALRDTGLVETLDRRVQVDGVPILGLCVGYQLMGHGSEEGRLPGLGWIDANATRLDPVRGTGLKVPHMGWAQPRALRAHPLVADLPDRARFYFVHSYAVHCKNRDDALLTCEHGETFDAAAQRGNIMGVQFHPEKSHRFGMTLFRNFVERC